MAPAGINHGGQPNMMNDNFGPDNNMPQYSELVHFPKKVWCLEKKG